MYAGGESIILAAGGVGYELAVPTRDIAKLSTGQQQALFIAEQIREDAHDLYGYLTAVERALHFKLVSVQGVGPRLAHAILSAYDAKTLTDIIDSEDIARLNQVSGVGKKTAQRMLLDLKGKLVAIDGVSSQGDDPAVAALVQLGFQRDQALRALQEVDKSAEAAERIRQALKVIKR